MPQGARRTVGQVGFVVVLAGVVAWFLSWAAERHGFFDLEVYHGALSYWVHDGGEVYDYLKPRSKYGFTYPPFAALVMLPMAFLSWNVAILVSVTLSVLASTVVIWWLLDPVAVRAGWTRWFTLAVALCLAAAFEPMRETVNFGQVNMLLLFLVAVDLLWLAPRGSRWLGVGIGLATAIKLTPGIYLVYLLVTGRWRAAATATAVAGGTTLLAAALFPDASREYWTQAFWNTDRVGELAFISNQSLQGVVARLDPGHPSAPLWLLLVAVTVLLWARRSRAAVAVGDEATGFALTGVVMCLVSPVTWVHHLVWLIPALILLVDNAMAAPAGGRRRRGLLAFAAVAYLVLISRLVWHWERGFGGVDGFVFSNFYVWISLALLVALPIRRPAPGPAASPPGSVVVDTAGVPQLREGERGASTGQRYRIGRLLAVR
ncbi:glycosyltransferase 87 family protein [Micromonospora echinospora]|uniref:glycosyltransferase 87 family protein n=1 Tax=Micromonospora echinospora TaxID=1877 RepID=UPI00366D48A3